MNVVLHRVRLVLARAQPRSEGNAIRATVKVTEADCPVWAQVGVLSPPGAVQRVTDLPRNEPRSPALQLNPELVMWAERSATVDLQLLLKVKPMNGWLSCRVEVFDIVTIKSKRWGPFTASENAKFSLIFFAFAPLLLGVNRP